MKENTPRYYSDLKEIFISAVKRVDPAMMIKNLVSFDKDILSVSAETEKRSFDLSQFDSVIVLGAGKATAKMAAAVEDILGSRISGGLISVKKGHTEPLKYIKTIQSGHPVPDRNSVTAGKEIAALCKSGSSKTLFINLISGGGSALLSFPLETDNIRLSLEEKQSVTKLLLSCGAEIKEINCIRKHISGIKGGRLAELMYPASSLNLILSDVVGDRLDSIASGLSSPDQTTFSDALDIIKKYSLTAKIPSAVLKVLEQGGLGKIPDTPESSDIVFSRVANILLGSNISALRAAGAHAESLGYNTLLLSSRITGEAKEAAKFYMGICRDIRKYGLVEKRPACIIAGGETTVTIRGNGLGGRNQEMALSFLSEISDSPEDSDNIFFLSAGTDGNDGPTDAAGAFASLEILNQGEKAGLNVREYLNRNDSYNYFNTIERLLKTGPTNTNVCDIQIMLIP